MPCKLERNGWLNFCTPTLTQVSTDKPLSAVARVSGWWALMGSFGLGFDTVRAVPWAPGGSKYVRNPPVPEEVCDVQNHCFGCEAQVYCIPNQHVYGRLVADPDCIRFREGEPESLVALLSTFRNCSPICCYSPLVQFRYCNKLVLDSGVAQRFQVVSRHQVASRMNQDNVR